MAASKVAVGSSRFTSCMATSYSSEQSEEASVGTEILSYTKSSSSEKSEEEDLSFMFNNEFPAMLDNEGGQGETRGPPGPASLLAPALYLKLVMGVLFI